MPSVSAGHILPTTTQSVGSSVRRGDQTHDLLTMCSTDWLTASTTYVAAYDNNIDENAEEEE